jgi:hypothetical protein
MATHSDACERREATHVYAALFEEFMAAFEDCVVLRHLHIVWQFAYRKIN